jgi:antitoxin (DNA-binding transcriptional repressor) of toxin-antitoxin stability system
MSHTITIEEAQVSLKELVHRLAPGEEVVITENQQPVARLVCEAKPGSKRRPDPGLGKGLITIVTDDDEHLQAFAEYMP